MSTATHKYVRTVHLGNGTLVFQSKRETGESYDGPVTLKEGLEFRDEKTSVPVETFEELKNLIVTRGINIVDHVTSDPEGFAWTVTWLLSLGSVLVANWLYSVAPWTKGISLETNQPRVEGTVLRFLTLGINLTLPTQVIKEVVLDLSNMDLTVTDFRVVPTKEKAE